MTKPWSFADIGPQTGKRIVITGANSGIGLVTALELARAGAEVVMPARSQAKADEAARHIRAQVPTAQILTGILDLSSLKSVRNFADGLAADGRPIDVLINNAGVMAIPRREVSVDGFEMQFATNVLGHFLLTGILLPSILRAPTPRVVTVSSSAHALGGPAPVPDLNSEQSYKSAHAYSKTKLENVLFARELQRRAGARLLSVSCHPGVARTKLMSHEMNIGLRIASFLSLLVSQSAERGAEPTLYAATSPDAKPAAYYGPGGKTGLKGPVRDTRMADFAYDDAAAKQLFEQLEEMAGIRYAL
jgi:NAD(P)-dependent dehydrogenase (short-subunit alcohol dehydrogenase family)